MTRRLTAALVSFLICTGCASKKPLYHWGSYEDDLYAMYKKPEKSKEYQETLRLIMETCDKSGQRVPPGIRAEYGYCLYKEGKLDEAVVYFKKERDAWPESVYLMNTLIASVERLKTDGDVDKVAPVAEPARPTSED
jgi:hypothetical protein